MKSCVAAIDCGTTAVKSAIVDLEGRIKGLAGQPAPCTQFADGRIETDARALLTAGLGSLRMALQASKVHPRNVEALAITNQRATVLCLDAAGKPLGNAISWQDQRGAPHIEALRPRLPDGDYYAITGLPNNAVFTLAKILWVMADDPARYRKTARFALVQDYLLNRLGCDGYFCDSSNASLTGLLDISTLAWSETILSATGIPRERLPDLVSPGIRVGRVSREAARRTGLLEGTPLVSGGGDQQCAGVGAGAVVPGLIEITLGTAAVPLCCSATVARDPKRRVMCCAHAVPGKWNLEGLQNSAGACLRWASHLINKGKPFPRKWLDRAGGLEPGSGGVMFYPYLAGDSAPHWSPEARGMFLGLTLAHGPLELTRAVMEGVSMQTREILDVFDALGVPIREIRLTGGCTVIDAWNQMQADLFGKRVSTLETPQASLLGAAILAAKGMGGFPSIAAAVRRMVRLHKTYEPEARRVALYESLYRKYCSIRCGFDDAAMFATIAGRK